MNTITRDSGETDLIGRKGVIQSILPLGRPLPFRAYQALMGRSSKPDYGFSDAFDRELLFCAKQRTHNVDNRGRAGALA